MSFPVFSFFQNFDLVGCWRGKREKMAQNVKKIISLTPYLRNHTSYDCGFWYTRVK